MTQMATENWRANMDYNEHGKVFLYKFLLTDNWAEEYRNGSILNLVIKGLQGLEKPHTREKFNRNVYIK